MNFLTLRKAASTANGLITAAAKTIIGLALLATPTLASAAPMETGQGYINFYGAGWTIALARVQLDMAFANPEGCTMTDGYVTDPATSGHDLFNSTLLTAYISRKKVSLVLDGCLLNRPRIIGVYVWP